MNHQISRNSRPDSARSRGARRGGFTLVEIIVVLVIVTVISSIVFAAFKSIREGNKKTSCQTNMVQIYQALRLYGQDFDGQFPSYNPVSGTAAKEAVVGRDRAGLGLWALYAYPASAELDCDGRTTQLPLTDAPNNVTPPLASYIKSPSAFHCPYDDFDYTVTPSDGCDLDTGATLNSSQLEFTNKSGQVVFNPFYNSYQAAETYPGNDAAALDNSPYSSFRSSGSSRQLVYWQTAPSGNIINEQRRTPDTTVITWCRFHRKVGNDGLTVEKPSNSDNVLFMDGTVQFISTKQDIGPTPVQCEAWRRAPKETVASLTACPN